MRGRRSRSNDRLLELDEVELRLRPFGEAYFVIDGHHRAALARRRGVSVIGDGGRRRRLRLPGLGSRSPA